MQHYYPKLLMAIKKDRNKDVLKGAFLLLGIVGFIVGMYFYSDHAQDHYSAHTEACASNDIVKCPELLLTMK